MDTWRATGATLAGEFAGWSDAAGIARIALRLLLALLLAAAGMGAVTAILGTLLALVILAVLLRLEQRSGRKVQERAPREH